MVESGLGMAQNASAYDFATHRLVQARCTAPERPRWVTRRGPPSFGRWLWELKSLVVTRPGPAAEVGVESARPCPVGWLPGHLRVVTVRLWAGAQAVVAGTSGPRCFAPLRGCVRFKATGGSVKKKKYKIHELIHMCYSV
jgi:hypothetical protein